MRLVLIEQIISERAARRIEHHCDALRRFFLDHLVQHVQHAKDRAGRFALRITERRQGVEGSIQIGRAVDQDEFARAQGFGAAGAVDGAGVSEGVSGAAGGDVGAGAGRWWRVAGGCVAGGCVVDGVVGASDPAMPSLLKAASGCVRTLLPASINSGRHELEL